MWAARVTWCAAAAGLLAYLTHAHDKERVAHTAQGAVRGYLSGLGDFFAFYGIPYATAPTGRDKFKKALPPPEWDTVFEATNDQIICPQPDFGPVYKLDGFPQENCLIVNVFVPKTTQESSSLPVMVYIHGGGFAGGSGNMATHELLIRHGVIVVNFNYRVGPHGFLCLGTKDIPGNAGMKDQVAALLWVKRNIKSFGGNPGDITIGGYSAGGASVELLMLSPMAQGLFTKAISESGSALNPWAVNPDPIAMAKRFITDLTTQEINDLEDIEEFYKSLSIEQLTSKIYLSDKNSNLGFGPCVESRIEEHDSFLNEPPYEILKSGKYNTVPYMTGFASEEGLFRINLFDEWKDEMTEKFVEFLPQDLSFVDEFERKHVAEKVKWFYFKDEPVGTTTINQFVNYFTDVMFGYSTIRSARLHVANAVTVYLYDYSYVIGKYPPQAHSDKIKGAFHCAQSQSLHRIHFMKRKNISETDILMEDRLTKMWTDFAKFGTPVKSTSALLPVSWDPMDLNKINYLSMDVELQSKERILEDRVSFWDSIYREYYRNPHEPVISRLHTEL